MTDAVAPDDPAYPHSLLVAGVAAMNDGRNDEAIDCFDKLVRIRPIGSVYASLAECCWRADRFEEALRAVDAAVSFSKAFYDRLLNDLRFTRYSVGA